MDQALLQSWYRALASRIVDLVGDFAGDELFIVEGDSLLLHCFSNPKLDFCPGFQVLHASYLVEKFLQKLRKRNCVFEVVFFAQHAPLCIPATADRGLHDRYLLAREALIQHLKSISLKTPSRLRVIAFHTFYSGLFEAHLISSGAYLFMCHDGAFAEQRIDVPRNSNRKIFNVCESESSSEGESDEESFAEGEKELEPEETSSRIVFRKMIRWFIAKGYNVALINSIQFRDTKVMAMIIEGSVKQAHGALPSQDHLPLNVDLPLNLETSKPSNQGFAINSVEQAICRMEVKDAAQYESLSQGDSNSIKSTGGNRGAAHIGSLLERLVQERPYVTQRECLALVTICAMISEAATPARETTIGVQSMILHFVLLRNTQLADRSLQFPRTTNSAYFERFLATSRVILNSVPWADIMKRHTKSCDLYDLMDGRLFFEAQSLIEGLGLDQVISAATLSEFNNFASFLDDACGSTFRCEMIRDANAGARNSISKQLKTQQRAMGNTNQPRGFTKVLPFANAIFDKHLTPVHLDIDESTDPEHEIENPRDFQDHSHWHNSKPLDQKRSAPMTNQQLLRNQRRNQRYMAEMRQYAESLLGSAGMSQPEIVVVGSVSKSPQKSPAAILKAQNNSKSSSSSKKKTNAETGKPSAKEIAALTIQQKAADADRKQVAKWTYICQQFAQTRNPLVRFKGVSEYLSGLAQDSRRVLEPEILTYLLDTLLQAIFIEPNPEKGDKCILIATHAWEIITRLMRITHGISAHTSRYVEKVCKTLGLPTVRLQSQGEQSLSFKLSPIPRFDITIGMSSVEFQLLHGGPFMERSMDSRPDPRTPDFEPDRWQRDVLDQIDAKKSAFIVAPTSAGKTFISFYAMKQILKEDNDGVLVYVAPTKALVNQIAAEVQARFSKSFPTKTSGKSVWAIHTRDHRINDPRSCQILITVPHILQIMLLAPMNAKAWIPRLKRIIFDEVHCIGQADDGVVWEQLLLLSPCPIIALSATVGNPQQFYGWLKHAQSVNGFELKMIQHQHRYSDLRKYLYHPPQTFSFKGLPSPSGLSRIGLDEATDIHFLHPVLSLVDRSRGIPEDFSLEPRDCLSLWKTMRDLHTDQFPIDPCLDPEIAFSDRIIQKKHIFEWQKSLKDLLRTWMNDRESPFEALVQRLSQPGTNLATVPECTEGPTEMIQQLLETTLPLICSLHGQGALPALFFNYDRSACEDICHQLLNQLQESEAKWKEQSSSWRVKLAKWNNWKRSKEEAQRRAAKATKVTKKKAPDDEIISRAEQMRDSASADGDLLELFDPERPLAEFSLADPKKFTQAEFAEYTRELKDRGIPKWLIDALERGIGVHHAGMNRKYRQVCEILFRKGFLRVVIATGTLALGINMPCKTVVFSGDSIFLTALNFRQGSGRAGRRGFDVLGNVVFQHVPTGKVHRLISSRLPDLNGHFPLTTSLVLRLFILLHGSKQAPSAVSSINSILSSPRICLGGPEMKETVLHFLRFSIEYLRRNQLLGRVGAPLNFAGCISHLYYTESSSFAFHALLRSNYFHHLCKDINCKPKKTLRTLMLVMAHIFGRTPLRQATSESYHAADKRPCSVVVLPELPKSAAKALNAHNNQVLDIYIGYVSSYIEQHVKVIDRYLPFSGIKCGGDKSAVELGVSQSYNVPTRITSPFFALSGSSDKWKTIADLSEMVRGDVWLEESVIPYVPVGDAPLNAYLYDFFKHGNVHQLISANRVPRGDVWFLLNDFSLVLATLTTSLENFVNSEDSTTADMPNVSGGGDSFEMEREDRLLGEGTDTEGPGIKQTNTVSTSRGPMRKPAASQKAPRSRLDEALECWEDEMVDDPEAEPVNKRPLPRRCKQENRKSSVDNKSDHKPKADKSKKSLNLVCKAFKELQLEFDGKFKEMWA